MSYESENITDADIQRIINEAFVQKQCTELDLSYNKITHNGAAILAKTLQNNEVRNLCYSSIYIDTLETFEAYILFGINRI